MTHPINPFIFVILLFVASVFLTGCEQGPNSAQVTGVVTIDGEAVKGVAVQFSPKSKERSAIGYTDANGKYTLRFTETKPGCIPGDHVVRITAYKDPEKEESQYLPTRYNGKAQDNEEMNLTVKKGKQEINFSLTSK